MKLQLLILKAFFLFFCIFSFGQEDQNISDTSKEVLGENELLYSTSWNLVKAEPEFDNSIGITLLFEKASMQLKVTKEMTTMPKLEGTKLITKRYEDINFYSWKYGALETIYDGDDVVEEKLDYNSIVLRTEGYEFKIQSITPESLVLEVIKAPRVIFGKSIFDVKTLTFQKK